MNKHPLAALTQGQITEFTEAFNLFATIRTQDLENVLIKLGKNLTEAELKDMIHEVDIEGTINLKDFLSLMARKMTDINLEEKLLQEFKIYDKFDTGHIPRVQLKQAIEKVKTFTDDELEEILRGVETDDDGDFDYKDFVRKMMIQ